MKLTDLGMRPIWQVTTRQPYVVPNLRKTLEKQSWGVFSGDIPFLNRLFLDLDLSMHIHAKGEIIDTIDASNNDMQQTVKVEQQVVRAGIVSMSRLPAQSRIYPIHQPSKYHSKYSHLTLKPALPTNLYSVRLLGLKIWVQERDRNLP